MSVRSMTGFARVRRTIAGYETVVSLKSVNHRGLDLHFHTSSDLDPFENAMRAAIKKKVGRGHVDVRVHVARTVTNGGLDVDVSKLALYVTTFRRAAAEYGLSGEPDLNAALRIPGMLDDSGPAEFPAGFEPELIDLLNEALDGLNQFRSREGEELAAALLEHNRNVGSIAEQIEEIRGRAMPYFHTRLKDRLAELIESIGLDPQRLAQEAAILTDRSDIGEETARLKIHARQLDAMLKRECEIGKKLDFLLQEMNRETNTILSKTSGIGEPGLDITALALEAKSEIEKIREQALNLE